DVGLADEARQARRETADLRAAPVPVEGAAAADIAAADDEIVGLGLEDAEHIGQQLFVVLKVGVGDGDEWRRAGEHALDACGGKAAPPDALDTADARIDARDLADQVGRAVA